MTGRTWRPITASRRAWWCPTCTPGSAPSGCAQASCWPGRAGASGRCAAIITAPIRGLRSAIRSRRTRRNNGCRLRPAVADDHLSRDEQILRLRRETFDVAVIGGGINGAAVARDAAMRGLRVALIEQGDFAGQTSSRSSKLIHGGLRYLPQGQLRLVYEALRERELLTHLTAPHLVRPIDFLFPVYAGLTVSPFMLSAGLFVYDLLARTAPAYRHQRLNAAQVTALEPQLKPTGL